MNKKITIGSRGSKLALLYAQKAKDSIVKVTNLRDEDVQIKAITTKGDQVQDTRLSEIGGKGLFSSNIEKELQDKNIDIAVHALKDLPAIETKGLITDTFLERTDPSEILISENKKKLRELNCSLPPLIAAYMNLSSSMKTFGTAMNSKFGDVEETGILISIDDIYPEKKDRHVNTYKKVK